MNLHLQLPFIRKAKGIKSNVRHLTEATSVYIKMEHVCLVKFINTHSSTDNESVTMARLHEHQVKRGKAREESFAVSQRRIVNQHRTGVLNNLTHVQEQCQLCSRRGRTITVPDRGNKGHNLGSLDCRVIKC
jgi:hypothetical protein